MAKDDRVELRRLFEKIGLKEHSIEKSESGGSPLSSEFEIDAEDFLHAAEDAFELGNHAEALTEAKRAIHCQIDEVMAALGYSWRRTNLRKKLDIVRRCGFTAPRIIHRVNAARNLLEHEYVRPSEGKATEALDIATLFVHATRRHFVGFMGDFYVGSIGEHVDTFHFRRELVFSFDEKKKQFRITAVTDVQPESFGRFGKPVGRLSVGSESLLFPAIVKLTLAGERQEKVTVAFHELFDVLRNAK